MQLYIKLAKRFQLNLEAINNIVETANWLSAVLPERVVSNSQEIALSGGKGK